MIHIAIHMHSSVFNVRVLSSGRFIGVLIVFGFVSSAALKSLVEIACVGIPREDKITCSMSSQ